MFISTWFRSVLVTAEVISAVRLGWRATDSRSNSFAKVDKKDTKLFRRQAFVPEESLENGETCEDAFGTGYLLCATANIFLGGVDLCFNPDLGDECCENKCEFVANKKTKEEIEKIPKNTKNQVAVQPKTSADINIIFSHYRGLPP